jgi:hypothetical protein
VTPEDKPRFTVVGTLALKRRPSVPDLLDGSGDRPLAFAIKPCLLAGCDKPQVYKHHGFCSPSHSNQYVKEKLAANHDVLGRVGRQIMEWDLISD